MRRDNERRTELKDLKRSERRALTAGELAVATGGLPADGPTGDLPANTCTSACDVDY